jgi:hypothetical protein
MPLVVSLQNLLKCNVDIRINLSPIPISNRVASKNSSVSLVMQSREDQQARNAVATDCRTVASSRRECPSPQLPGQPKEKASSILGCLHSVDSDTGDAESRILSYQKISVMPEASTTGNISSKAGEHTPKVDSRRRHGCFSKILPRGECAACQESKLCDKHRAPRPRKGLFSCCFCKIRPDCRTKADAVYRSQTQEVFHG